MGVAVGGGVVVTVVVRIGFVGAGRTGATHSENANDTPMVKYRTMLNSNRLR